MDEVTQEEREDCYSATLHITDADATDSRSYYLAVENDKGRDRHAVKLYVNGMLFPPNFALNKAPPKCIRFEIPNSAAPRFTWQWKTRPVISNANCHSGRERMGERRGNVFITFGAMNTF